MASKKSIIDFMEENYDLNKTSNMTLEDAINSGRARAKSNSSNIKTKKKKKKNKVNSFLNEVGNVTGINKIKDTGKTIIDNVSSSKHFEDGYNFGDVTKTAVDYGNKAVDFGKNLLKFDKAVDHVKDTGKEAIDKLSKGNVIGAGKEIAQGILEGQKIGLKTGTDVALNFTKGVFNVGENIGDKILYGTAEFIDKTGIGSNIIDTNILREETQKGLYNDFFQPSIDIVDKDSILTDSSRQIAETTGSMYATGQAGKAIGGTYAPGSDAANIAQKVGTYGTIYQSASGSAYTQALNEGATPEEARKYSIMSGATEVGTELMFDGVGFFTKADGGVDSQLVKKATSGIKNKKLRNITEGILLAQGEGFEEVAAGVGNAYAKKLTYRKDATMDELLKEENLFESYLMGMTSAEISQVGNVRQANNSGRDLVTNYTQLDEDAIKNETDRRIAEEEQDGNKLSKKEKQEIREKVEEDYKSGEINIGSIRKAYNQEQYDKYKTSMNEYEAIRESYNQNQKEINSLDPVKDQERINELRTINNELEQRLNNSNAYTLKNDLDNQIRENNKNSLYLEKNFKNYEQRNVNYEYDDANMSENEKAIHESIKQSGAMNTKAVHRLADSLVKLDKKIDGNIKAVNTEQMKQIEIDKMVKDELAKEEKSKGYKLEGTELSSFIKNATTNASNIIEQQYSEMRKNNTSKNGFVIDGNNVYVNMQSLSNKYQTLIHEVLHTKENSKNYKTYTEELFKFAEKYGINDKSLDEIREEIIKNYNLDINDETQKAVLDSELAARLSEEFLGNEEFVREISQDKTIFRKILDTIKGLIQDFTGTPFEKDLRKIEKMYEKVLNEEFVSDEKETKYSKKLNGYKPDIKVFTKDVDNFGIKNINKESEVINVISNRLKNTYLSTQEISKPITNIDTGINVEIWKSSINESFGKPEYYKKLSNEEKLKKLSIVDNLAKMIKYGEVRTNSQPNKHNPNSPAIYYYLNHPVTIDDQNYMVNMDIRKVPNQNGRFYIYSITTKKAGTSGNLNGRQSNVPAIGKSVSQNNQNVNSIKNSIKDNKGRNLTVEQQEYFKDSKVRDENGNLLTMYHGSSNKFTIFDRSYSNTNNVYGNGLYFTSIKELATNHSKDNKLYEVYLNIVNPLQEGQNKITKEQIEKVIKTIKFNKQSADFIFGKNATIDDKVNYLSDMNDDFLRLEIIDGLSKNNLTETIEIFNKLTGINYDGIITDRETVVFNSNQVKNVDNTNPTENEDIRYSLKNNQKENELKAIGDLTTKENYAPIKQIINEYEIAPIKSQIKKEVEIPYQVQKTPEKGIKIAKNDTINSNIEEDMIIDPTIPDLKERKWHKTALESSSVEGIINEEDLDLMKRVYEVKTNKKTLEEANSKLNTLGYDKSVDYFKSQLMNKKISTEDIALGQRLIQESLQKGDNSVAIDLIQDIAIIGTELGQQMQALSLIQRMTPTGQLRMIQKTIDRGKITNPKVYDGVEFTESMQKKILDTYNKDGVTYDQNKLNDAIENVKQDIAKQLKVTKMEKLNEWRYLAMLGNPKTHIRNLVSNVAMKATRQLKDIQARTIEDIFLRNNENRTRTWKQSSKYIKEYSKQTTEEMKELITGTKYNEQQELLAKRKIFKNELLNKVAKLNSDLLAKEDWWFSKSAFKNSYEEFLTANNIRTEQDVLENPELIEKAKNYALEQSQIATFRQYSKFAASLNQLSKNNKVAGFVIESTMPFKKTPINVAKAGLNYSVFGLGKTITYDAYKLTKGEITASQYIDNLAQGTTGTGLMVLGYILASMGMVTGAGDEDKEAVYDSQLGGQSYSIVIGGKSYSIDWLSPVAMPFLVGAQAYEVQEKEMEITPDLFFEAVANTLDPMQEMSFMSSFNQVMRTYAYNGIQGVLEDTAQNYVLQYVPTLSSQIAATADDTKRSTAAGKDSKFRFGEETYRKFAYKIPGLRQTLEPTLDIWGNEVKQNENITKRFFDNFIAPYKEKGRTNTLIDDELLDVYNMTGRKEALPTSSPNKYVTYDKEQYNMTAKQFTEYKRTLGTTSYETLEDLFDTDAYKNASYEDKSKMIEKVFSYSKETAKSEFLDAKGVDYEVSDGTKKIKGAIDNNMGLEEYTAYKENPGKYKTITQIDSYENYSIYKNEISEIKEKNKTTSTRKNAVMNYINTLNITPAQKLMLYKQAGGYSIKGYENYIVSYLNSTNLSLDDKRTIYNELFS